MRALFNLLVNLVQILLHLLSSCFQKKEGDSRPSVPNFKGLFVHDLRIFCWL